MNPAQILVASVAERITLPVVYHRIRQLIDEPDAKITDYVDVINMDSALATRIIRIANSTFFGYRRKANTVKQAISLIGVMQLHDLLLSSLAIRAFSGIPVEVLDQEQFWRSSIYCGIVARLLAKHCGLPANDKLFTLGLLHEIGHVVMFTRMSEQLQDIIIEANMSDISLYKLEREKLGYDYGMVGKEIMRLWNLPENYWAITANHVEPNEEQIYNLELSIVSFSRELMLELTSESTHDAKQTTPPIYKNLANKINKDSIEKIKIQAGLYVDDVMDCLWPFARNTQQDCVILL